MSNKILFSTTDPEGRAIDLSENTWKVHKQKHPEIKSFHEIKKTVQSPDFITKNPKRKSLAYSKIVNLRTYLNVYTCMDNTYQQGHVTTAFIQDSMPRGSVIWRKRWT